MQSIIEELYYGNVLQFERRIPKCGEYSHIMKSLTRNEEELLKTLTETQKEIFEKFKAKYTYNYGVVNSEPMRTKAARQYPNEPHWQSFDCGIAVALLIRKKAPPDS